MSGLDAVADEGGNFGLYKAQCQWCRFYHHGDGTCIRHAPTPSYDQMESIAEKVMMEFGKDYEFSSRTHWPSVEKTDACGEFDRGAGLGKLTLQQQKELWPDEFTQKLADANPKSNQER